VEIRNILSIGQSTFCSQSAALNTHSHAGTCHDQDSVNLATARKSRTTTSKPLGSRLISYS